MQLVPDKQLRVPQPYSRKMGSGYFWVLMANGWHVFYVNAVWGVLMGDGRYESPSRFTDFEGPLMAPTDGAA